MKKTALLLTILFSFAAHTSFSQIQADAGTDQFICDYEINEGAVLDGSASGGTPPYTYVWETEISYTIGDFFINYSASDFLNDTTLAEPEITDAWGDTLEFRLTVTDAEGAVDTDSVTVIISRFGMHLGYVNYTINQGDSIFLTGWENVSGGIPPHEVLWQPNHGLTDSTSFSFWAKPETSVGYYMTLTDSVGCSVTGAPVYFVDILPLSTADGESGDARVHVFPNPAEDFINVQIDRTVSGAFTFRLFSSAGRLVESWRLNGPDFRVDVSDRAPGVYIYEVTNDRGFSERGRFAVTK